MLISLHKQATTTPKIRAAIQASDEPAWVVAERYGISEQTVWKWRKRESAQDRSHERYAQKLVTLDQAAELKRVISHAPDISPTLILRKSGNPHKFESIGNMFGEAAKVAGMKARLHGLRKAFCVYRAEKGKTTHQIAAMAGHLTLKDVERYTRAADLENIARLIMTGS